MRYIRLKNEIIDVYSKFGFNEKYCDEHKDKFEEEFAKYAINEHVIKRSNSIEELCDQFVFIDNFYLHEHRVCHSFENAIALSKKHNVDIKTFRGAIWTDKGLTYVAKMNDKGELELL